MLKKITLGLIVYFCIICKISAAQVYVIEIENYYIKYNNSKIQLYMFEEIDSKKILFNLFINERVYNFSSRTMNIQSYDKISNLKKNDIQDILYLGYGYNNQKELKWYLLSQYFVYRELGYDIDIIDESDVSITKKFNKEYQQYLDRIEYYKIIPSYLKNPIELNYNEKILLEDKNNVDDKFVLIPHAFTRIKEENNNKYLHGIEPAITKLSAVYKESTNGFNKIYYNEDFALIDNVAMSKRTFETTVYIHGGKIKLMNIDQEGNPIPNTIYKIYDSHDKVIARLITSNSGEAKTGFIKKDNYYIIEDKIDEKYAKNKNKIIIDFNDFSTTELTLVNNLIKTEEVVPENDNNEVLENDFTNNNNIDDFPEEEHIVINKNTCELEDNNSKESYNFQEFMVPNTNLDITKYVIFISLLLLLVGFKLYAK